MALCVALAAGCGTGNPADDDAGDGAQDTTDDSATIVPGANDGTGDGPGVSSGRSSSAHGMDGSGTASGSTDGAAVEPCAEFEEDVVWPGDVHIETQADVAALMGVACVAGDVIVSHADVVDVDGLEALVRVEGSLAFGENEALASLDGLGSLTYVGGGLFFDQNEVLTGASLPSLAEIGVVLMIGQTGSKGGPWGNPSLVGVDFPMLTVIHGDIEIRHNPLLASLDGLDALETIDGHSDLLLNEERVLAIFGNASLAMEDAHAFANRFAFDHVIICGNGGDPPC